jgi:hypothetical protein
MGGVIQPTAEGRVGASLRQQAPVRSKTESDVILQSRWPTASAPEGKDHRQPRPPPLHLDIPQLSGYESYQPPNWSAQPRRSQTTQPTSSEPNGKHWVRDPPEGRPNDPKPHPHRHLTQGFATGAASSSKVTAIRHRNTMPERQELRRIFDSPDRK